MGRGGAILSSARLRGIVRGEVPNRQAIAEDAVAVDLLMSVGRVAVLCRGAHTKVFVVRLQDIILRCSFFQIISYCCGI